MPLPKPNQGETLEAFGSRCMSNESVLEEYPDEEQRIAICSSLWESSQKNGTELTAPIVFKDEERRIVYGPVLVPGIKDSDGDVVTAEKIEVVAHKFLEEYRLMELMHTLKAVARPVESYLAPMDLVFGDITIPKGSWVAGAKIQDDDAWEDVKKGKLTGFSIIAVPTGVAKSESAEKKLTLREIEDSGRDWEVVAIGLVDQPAVPLAKWTAIKSKTEPETVLDKFKSLFSGKAGRTISAANRAKIQDVIDGLQDLIEEDDQDSKQSTKEVDVDKEELQELLNEAVKPLTERLDALEDEGGEEGSEKSESGSDDGDKKTVTITQEEYDALVGAEAESAAEKAVKKVFEHFDEKLDSKPKASGKSLVESLRGQDGHSEKKESKPTRDPWGRRIREEAK